MLRFIVVCVMVFVMTGFVFGQDDGAMSPGQEQAKMKMTQGKQYLADFRYGKAMDKFNEAIALDPKAKYIVQRAEGYLEVDRVLKAQEDFQLAIKVDSTEGLGYLGVAKCFLLMDRSNDSLQWYLDHALHHCTRSKEQAVALTTMAELKVMEGQFDQAEKYASTATSLDSTNINSSVVLASVLIEIEGKQDQAIDILEDVLKKENNNMRYMINLGYMYNKVERYSDGLQILNKALDYEMDNPYVLANKAFSLVKLGQLDQADKAVAKAIKNDQSNAYSHYVKGLLIVEQNSASKACKHFNKALERALYQKDRSFTDIKQAIAKHCVGEE